MSRWKKKIHKFYLRLDFYLQVRFVQLWYSQEPIFCMKDSANEKVVLLVNSVSARGICRC